MTITSNIPKINVEAKPLACKAGNSRNASRVRKTPLTFQAGMSGSAMALQLALSAYLAALIPVCIGGLLPES